MKPFAVYNLIYANLKKKKRNQRETGGRGR
jgi:hypothetical protein